MPRGSLLNSKDPSVTPFVEELQRRLLRLHHATKSHEGGVHATNTDWTNLYDLGEPQSRVVSPQNFFWRLFTVSGPRRGAKADGRPGLENQDGLKVLPFEFIALEACLEAACSCLENEV
ncbi:Magnesium transporter MRS2-3 [Vitis vinifera]|uniref:Magnesium transporter MRS2-3 n=1 Tax=Vitis vinifera TaxID=29760 RepID=A0A438HDS2_VITVI|nr:Magnesium transporter MRS2-3 [Vitis vinifera]